MNTGVQEMGGHPGLRGAEDPCIGAKNGCVAWGMRRVPRGGDAVDRGSMATGTHSLCEAAPLHCLDQCL